MAEQILVVYFSRSGNTRKIANLIHQEVGGTIHEIQPEAPYPNSYDAVVDQAGKKYRQGTNLHYNQHSIMLNRTTRFLLAHQIGGVR